MEQTRCTEIEARCAYERCNKDLLDTLILLANGGIVVEDGV